MMFTTMEIIMCSWLICSAGEEEEGMALPCSRVRPDETGWSLSKMCHTKLWRENIGVQRN